MKIDVLFVRSFTPDYDGKFHKYQQALSDSGLSWSFLGWDRSGEFVSKFDKQSILYRKKALIGGGWRNLFSILKWNIFSAYQIWKNRNNIEIVHIIDFDSAIFTFPLAKVLKKKIIFDVYDKYTSMRSFPSILKKIIDCYERKILLTADLSILADECRFQQHDLEQKKNMIILENVPKTQESFNKTLNLEKNPNNFVLGYFGVLERNNRGLEDTVNAIIDLPNWEFHVAGYGELDVFFTDMAQLYPNKIKYYGAQDSFNGLTIMKQSDLMLGLYYKNVPNHLYAAPNKYFEHLMLEKPLLTTIGTPPGNKVLKEMTGWCIEENEQSISELLVKISKKSLSQKGVIASQLWKKKYNTYFTSHYLGIYTSKIREFLNV